METCLDIIDDQMYISTDSRQLKNKIAKFSHKYPDAVRVLAKPEENEGVLYCVVPASWFSLRLPREISDEKRAAFRENMSKVRQSINEEESNDN